PAQEGGHERGSAQAVEQRSQRGDHGERGQEDRTSRHRGARGPAQEISYERCRARDRSRRELSRGDGIEELPFGDPAARGHQFRSRKRKEEVSRSVQDGADLEEDPRQRGQRDDRVTPHPAQDEQRPSREQYRERRSAENPRGTGGGSNQ